MDEDKALGEWLGLVGLSRELGSFSFVNNPTII